MSAQVENVNRIYLSPPDLRGLEAEYLLSALASGWVAPVGPDLEAFEAEVCDRTSSRHAVGLANGTAAIHLALKVLGVTAGDIVLVPTLTFIASATPITFLGATPLFIDSEPQTWNIDPELVSAEINALARRGVRPRASISVDLYGQCAAYNDLLPILDAHNIPLVEDAAEALGATYATSPAGSFGKIRVLSFNGNKIVTTSGGGMLLTDDADVADRVRYLATQARQLAPHYEHTEIGYNYRLSNLLAALGRAQLSTLEQRIARRTEIYDRYVRTLSQFEGVSFQPIGPQSQPNHWLTCMVIDRKVLPVQPEAIRLELERHNIEARPIWKPLHLQPVFRKSLRRINGVADRLFESGLCLPSGSSMLDSDLERVLTVISEFLRKHH